MYPAEPDNSKQKAIAALIVILSVVILTVGVKAYDNKQAHATAAATTSFQQPPSNTPAQTNPSSATSAPPAANSTGASQNGGGSSSGYKDGTYTASAFYFVPHSEEGIQVSLTLSGGIVTNSSIQNTEGDPVSASFQQDFTATYKSKVVGKSISSLHLSTVAGASDTTKGFNDAVSQIQSKAKA